jgi:hypothetical protein
MAFQYKGYNGPYAEQLFIDDQCSELIIIRRRLALVETDTTASEAARKGIAAALTAFGKTVSGK